MKATQPNSKSWKRRGDRTTSPVDIANNFIKINTRAPNFGCFFFGGFFFFFHFFCNDGEDAGASEGGGLLAVPVPSHNLARFAQRFQLQNEQAHQRELGVGSHTSRPRDRELRVSLSILLLHTFNLVQLITHTHRDNNFFFVVFRFYANRCFAKIYDRKQFCTSFTQKKPMPPWCGEKCGCYSSVTFFLTWHLLSLIGVWFGEDRRTNAINIHMFNMRLEYMLEFHWLLYIQ